METFNVTLSEEYFARERERELQEANYNYHMHMMRMRQEMERQLLYSPQPIITTNTGTVVKTIKAKYGNVKLSIDDYIKFMQFKPCE